MSNEMKCDRCGGTELFVTRLLDPTTSKKFEITTCHRCNYQRWMALTESLSASLRAADARIEAP
jgi:hypothetical protein